MKWTGRDKRARPAETAPRHRLPINQDQRGTLEGLTVRMRRIVSGDLPELYLRVNEVRAQFEIANKGRRQAGASENEQRLEHALKRLNSAKFCLEVAMVEVSEVIALPLEGMAPADAPTS